MQNTLSVILGKKGSGKSYFTKNKIIPKLIRPIFIIDPLHEYNNGVIYLNSDVLVNEVFDGFNHSGIYILRPSSDRDIPGLLGSIWDFNVHCSLVIEESDLLCNPHSILDELNQLIQYGRHIPIDLVFIARRASSINRNVTAQADRIVSFKQTEPRDIDALKRLSSDFDNVNGLGQYKNITVGESL